MEHWLELLQRTVGRRCYGEQVQHLVVQLKGTVLFQHSILSQCDGCQMCKQVPLSYTAWTPGFPSNGLAILELSHTRACG